MLMMAWFFVVRFVERIGWVMTLLILDVGGSVLLSLMLVETCLGFVVSGILSFLTFIDFSLPFLVLWLIMVILVVLLLILLSGLLVLLIRGVGWFMRFVIALFYPVHLAFGILNGSRFQLLLSVLEILLFGLTFLVFWLSRSLS